MIQLLMYTIDPMATTISEEIRNPKGATKEGWINQFRNQETQKIIANVQQKTHYTTSRRFMH
jgi:hypothetical protein